MSDGQKTHMISGRLGISFERASEGSAKVFEHLKSMCACTQNFAHDGSHYIDIDTGYSQGLAISEDFIGKVATLGGHFAGNPTASLLNRIVRRGPAAAL